MNLRCIFWVLFWQASGKGKLFWVRNFGFPDSIGFLKFPAEVRVFGAKVFRVVSGNDQPISHQFPVGPEAGWWVGIEYGFCLCSASKSRFGDPGGGVYVSDKGSFWFGFGIFAVMKGALRKCVGLSRFGDMT